QAAAYPKIQYGNGARAGCYVKRLRWRATRLVRVRARFPPGEKIDERSRWNRCLSARWHDPRSVARNRQCFGACREATEFCRHDAGLSHSAKLCARHSEKIRKPYSVLGPSFLRA